jgi:hypothetical protein
LDKIEEILIFVLGMVLGMLKNFNLKCMNFELAIFHFGKGSQKLKYDATIFFSFFFVKRF